MTLIGMPEAGKRLGLSSRSAKRALRDAGISLHAINQRALAVEETELDAFVAKRVGYAGRGRPRGTNEEPDQENHSNKIEDENSKIQPG